MTTLSSTLHCTQAAQRLRSGMANVPSALAFPLAALLEGAAEIGRLAPDYAEHAINAEDVALVLLDRLDG
jgi:hypothetical protein